MPGGQKLGEIWKYYERVVVGPKNIKAICNGCKKQMQGIPDRLKKHALECSELGIAPKRRREDDDAATSMENIVVKTKGSEIHKLNIQLTRAIVASNSPFSMAENNQVKKLFDMLRPGVQLAGRQAISGALLDAVYDEEIQKAKQRLKGNDIALVFLQRLP